MDWSEKKYNRELEVKKSLAQEILNTKRKERESMYLSDSELIEAMQEYANILSDRHLDLYLSGAHYALEKVFESGQQNVESGMLDSLTEVLKRYKKKNEL